MNDDGERHGEGTCTYIDGAKYVGGWKKGKRDGFGTFSLADGTRFEGDWENDKKTGKGKLFLSSGELVEAVWENDRLHGKGTVTVNGVTTEYIWYYDMKIDQVDQDSSYDRCLCNISFCVCMVIFPIIALASKSPGFIVFSLFAWIINLIEYTKSKTYGYLKKQVSLSQV